MLAKFKSDLGIRMNLKFLAAAAQLALVGAIVLGRFDIPETAFLQGLLIGFSLVGNLAWLIKQRS